MKLSVPHNWQSDLIDKIDLSCIESFYGKLQQDIVGGGRSSNICYKTSKQNIAHQISKLHSKKIKFNYLINSTCLNNMELSHMFQKKLHKLLSWLTNISVDSVTVSIPYLVKFIKKNYPNFAISASVMAQIDTPTKAKFWEDLGVDQITLFEVRVNKYFKLIEEIRNSVKCDLQLIANNACLNDCPLTIYHGTTSSHASQQNHILKGFHIDFYRIMCTQIKLNDPTNFIKADWIRPEDLHLYENLGINSIKIVNRGMATPYLKKIISAYTNHHFEGNLLELIPSPSKNITYNKLNLLHLITFFLRPTLINIFKLRKLKSLFNENLITIDNKKLDNYIQTKQTKKCELSDCTKCKYCEEIANKSININHKQLEENKKILQQFIDNFASGNLFSYFKK